MDRPTNLMVINSRPALRRAGRRGRASSRSTARRLVDAIPRFRQRVIESRVPLRRAQLGGRPATSISSTTCTISALPGARRHARAAGAGRRPDREPLDRNRPLWHIYLVDGFGDGAAMITRMHHCIADGIALAQVMLSLTDSAPDAEHRPGRRPTPGRAGGRPHRPGQPGAGWRAGAARLAIARRTPGRGAASPPRHTAPASPARSAATPRPRSRLLLTPADAATAIKGDPGVSRRVAWTAPLSLHEIKDDRARA